MSSEENRVVFISHYSGLYGANKSLIDLIDEISKRNYKSMVILPRYGDVCKVLDDKCITYRIIRFYPWVRVINQKKILKESIKSIINYLSTFLIKFTIKRFNADIVHTNSSCTEVGLKAASKLRIFHLWHIREFLEEDYSLEFIKKRKYVYKLFNKSERVIAISKSIFSKYEKEISVKKMVMIYNGVPIANSNRGLAKLNDSSQFKILLAGAITPAKGQKDAILALYTLKSKGIENIELYIAGTGTDYEIKMKNLVDELGLKNQVHFLGFIDDLNTLRETLDLALVCSSKEAFGRVTIEAMLSKMPVLGSNTGATPEIIIDGETGYLYEAGNVKDLAKKILDISSDFENLLDVSLKGYEHAKKSFTIEKTADKVLEIYRHNEI